MLSHEKFSISVEKNKVILFMLLNMNGEFSKNLGDYLLRFSCVALVP